MGTLAMAPGRGCREPPRCKEPHAIPLLIAALFAVIADWLSQGPQLVCDHRSALSGRSWEPREAPGSSGELQGATGSSG
eukprot:9771067-Alexandrium_andersonii.AAC.1